MPGNDLAGSLISLSTKNVRHLPSCLRLPFIFIHTASWSFATGDVPSFSILIVWQIVSSVAQPIVNSTVLGMKLLLSTSGSTGGPEISWSFEREGANFFMETDAANLCQRILEKCRQQGWYDGDLDNPARLRDVIVRYQTIYDSAGNKIVIDNDPD